MNESDITEVKSTSKHTSDNLKGSYPNIKLSNTKTETQSISSSSTDTIYNSPEDYLDDLKRTLERNTQRITEFVDIDLIKYNTDFKEIWNSEINFMKNL
ncbi:hypothetical protein JTB14_006496 [Gonioctena quinquepunctata]|nr:hypothetical protein JTB14_006496 [Gonioctena quinquepunctata]